MSVSITPGQELMKQWRNLTNKSNGTIQSTSLIVSIFIYFLFFVKTFLSDPKIIKFPALQLTTWGTISGAKGIFSHLGTVFYLLSCPFLDGKLQT